MLLWIVLTLMTAAAAVWVSAPFLRRIDARRSAAATDLEVYRDQLQEVARERTAGAIDADQAAAAETEIKRRLLSADRHTTPYTWALSLGQQHLSIVAIAGIVTLGSVILYANIGRPDLAAVSHEPTSLVLGNAASGPSFQPKAGGPSVPALPQSSGTPASGDAGPATAGNTGRAPLGSVDEMIARLLDRAKNTPTNPETWRMLGWSYFSTEHYAEAVDAYRRAVELQATNADLQTALGEALVRSANGTVKPDAAAAFDAALAIAPKDPKARYYKGLQLEQSGNKKAALDTWLVVLADAGAEEPWVPELRTRVTELAKALGVPVKIPADEVSAPNQSGTVLDALKQGQGQAPAVAAMPAPPRGPTGADVKAAEGMTAADRTQMIRGMVDGLAARLEKTPRDADGWLQLIRSRRVLGEMDAAKAALTRAMTVFADAPEDQRRIEAAAAELGVHR